MFNKSNKSISLVLPVYNEEVILKEAVEKVYMALKNDFEDFELILIDDGSKDKSYLKMLELKQAYPEIIVMQNLINLNQGVSIQRGFAISSKEYVVHNGIDLPLKPIELKQLIMQMDDCDLLVLERNIYSGATIWRKIVSKINIGLRSLMFPILSSKIRDMNFVQIYRQNIIKSVLPLAKSPAFTTPEMIFRAKHNGYKVNTKQMHFEARSVGKGSLGHLHDILWSTYDMFRFRFLLWIGLEKHGKTK
jgi:glycosyltransferase involved in cell wall biosynthesis